MNNLQVIGEDQQQQQKQQRLIKQKNLSQARIMTTRAQSLSKRPLTAAIQGSSSQHNRRKTPGAIVTTKSREMPLQQQQNRLKSDTSQTAKQILLSQYQTQHIASQDIARVKLDESNTALLATATTQARSRGQHHRHATPTASAYRSQPSHSHQKHSRLRKSQSRPQTTCETMIKPYNTNKNSSSAAVFSETAMGARKMSHKKQKINLLMRGGGGSMVLTAARKSSQGKNLMRSQAINLRIATKMEDCQDEFSDSNPLILSSEPDSRMSRVSTAALRKQMPAAAVGISTAKSNNLAKKLMLNARPITTTSVAEGRRYSSQISSLLTQSKDHGQKSFLPSVVSLNRDESQLLANDNLLASQRQLKRTSVDAKKDAQFAATGILSPRLPTATSSFVEETVSGKTKIRRPVSVQSMRTMQANSDINHKMQLIQNIESNFDPDVKNNKNVNLYQQLRFLGDQVKETQVKLNQLVCGGNKMMIVQPEHPVSIIVVAMNTAVIKVETKNHRGPLKFSVDFDSRGDGDLVTSVHSQSKVSLDTYIWQFKDRTRMTMRPFKAFDETLLTGKQTINDIDKNLWQPDAVFAQFFSQEGCSFRLTVNYIEEEAMRESRKNHQGNSKSIKHMRGKFYELVDKRVAETTNFEKEIRKVNKEIKMLKRARRVREGANVNRDYIKMNTEQTTEQAMLTQLDNVEKLRQMRRQRHDQAHVTREIKDAQTFRFNYLSLSRWDFLKQKRSEREADVFERIRQMRQVRALIMHCFTYEYIRRVYTRYKDRVAKKRFRMLQNLCAGQLQHNYKQRLLRYGPTLKARMLLLGKQYMNYHTVMTRDIQIERAQKTMLKFLRANHVRRMLQAYLRAVPEFWDKWRQKAFLVRKMVKRRRRFLTRIFEREKIAMIQHYTGLKKKQKKASISKTLTKLQSIKQHNLEKIIDDYYYGVCYKFYKRQIQIYIVLKYKYLRDEVVVQIDDKRFEFQGNNSQQLLDPTANENAQVQPNKDQLENGEADNANSETARKETENKKVVEKEVQYPIYFTEQDSEEVFKLSVGIKERLDFLFRGTSETSAVGNLADYLSLPPRGEDEYTSVDEEEERKKKELEQELAASAQKQRGQQSASFKDPFSALQKQLTRKKSSSNVKRKATGVADDLLVSPTTAANPNTVEQQLKQVAGQDDEHGMEETKAAKEPVNHYKQMGLEGSQVVMKKIAASLGFSLTKKGRGGARTGNKAASGASGSGGASGKSSSGLTRKRTMAVNKSSNGMDFASMHAAKQFIVQKPMSQPVLRYIPDRDLIQRLILRASNMKDDLGDFDIHEEHKHEEGEEGVAVGEGGTGQNEAGAASNENIVNDEGMGDHHADDEEELQV